MNDYDPLTAYLLFGQAKPAVPLDLDGRGLHRWIAQQTIALPNRTAWTAILPALKAAGVSHQDALEQCKWVWEERKRLRRQTRCGGETA